MKPFFSITTRGLRFGVRLFGMLSLSHWVSFRKLRQPTKTLQQPKRRRAFRELP